MRKWIFLVIFDLLLSSCIHIERTHQSGYSENSANPQTTNEKINLKNSNISKILAELGMNQSDLQTPEGIQRFQQAVEIKRLEANLSDDREKQQYFKNLPWLKDESEQLEFLKQNGYYGRQTWLRKKEIGKRPSEFNKSIEDLVSAKDIVVGMPNDIVRRSWGSPDSVDVAGNPLYGNERWRYKRHMPSSEGYRLQSRIVYFEAGKVVGWEQVDH